MMGWCDLPQLVLVVDRATPHAAGKNEPPTGPTIAKAFLVGPALGAGISAPCHCGTFLTGPCPSRHHAEYVCRPSASGIAARFHKTARRTAPVPTASASSQASLSGPSFVRHSVGHGTFCALLPGRYVRICRRFRTPLSQPLLPRTLSPFLGVHVFDCHHLIPRCHAGHPLLLAVSPPLLVPPRPLTLPPPMILYLILSHNSVSRLFGKQHENLYMTVKSIFENSNLFENAFLICHRNQ